MRHPTQVLETEHGSSARALLVLNYQVFSTAPRSVLKLEICVSLNYVCSEEADGWLRRSIRCSVYNKPDKDMDLGKINPRYFYMYISNNSWKTQYDIKVLTTLIKKYCDGMVITNGQEGPLRTLSPCLSWKRWKNGYVAMMCMECKSGQAVVLALAQTPRSSCLWWGQVSKAAF